MPLKLPLWVPRSRGRFVACKGIAQQAHQDMSRGWFNAELLQDLSINL